MTARLLLRGATLITCDPELGCFERGDLLVEGGRIRAVGRDLGRIDCEVMDLGGKIVLPGLIDTHRHVWQTPLRGLGADWTVLDYLAAVRVKLAPLFSAPDVYQANYLGALEALDLGVTTVVDFSHCINSPAHADAAIDGLEQAGIRALFCYGFADNAAGSPRDRFAHTSRTKQIEQLSASRLCRAAGLVRMGVALTEMQVPWEQSRAELACARELGLPITLHCAAWPVPGMSEVERMSREGLLGPDMLLVHCTHSGDEDLSRIADAGASISATPETELQMGMGMPVVGRALRKKVRTTLGCDVVCSNNGDPFAMMRLAMQVERGLANAQAGLVEGLELSVEKTLSMMTIDAAHALGMSAEIGSLTAGKQADLVILSTDTMNMTPLTPCGAALVTQAHAGNVESVMVRGCFVKRGGKLLGVDVPAVQRSMGATRDALLARAGGPALLLSERANLLARWNMGQQPVGVGPSG